MKSKNDFLTKEEYEQYLLFYFSGLAMQGLANEFHGEVSCTNAKYSVKLAKELILELNSNNR